MQKVTTIQQLSNEMTRDFLAILAFICLCTLILMVCIRTNRND